MLIVILVISAIAEMCAIWYADSTRIDGAITYTGGIVLLIAVPITGFLMAKSGIMLMIISGEK